MHTDRPDSAVFIDLGDDRANEKRRRRRAATRTGTGPGRAGAVESRDRTSPRQPGAARPPADEPQAMFFGPPTERRRK